MIFFLGAFAVAFFLPVFVRFGFELDLLFERPVSNTLAINFVAVCICLFSVRRIYKIPTSKSVFHTFVLVSVIYAFGFAIILNFRLEYSRYLIVFSYSALVTWLVVFQFVRSRFLKYQFAIIPTERTKGLLKIGGVDWHVLDSSEEFGESLNQLRNRILHSKGSEDSLIDKPRTSSWFESRHHGLVVDLRAEHSKEWERLFAEATLLGVPVYHYRQIEETLTGKTEIEHLSENSFGSILPDLRYLKLKSLIDILTAILLLPIILPLIAIVGLCVLIFDGGPIFYVQKRVGFRGVSFNAYKIRTMRTTRGAEAPEAHGGAQAEKSQDSNNDIENATTKERDQRITKIGTFLRTSRLDELPQVFNIIKGEMSWIGPRPEAEALSMHYEKNIPFYRYRHAVKPGISGWAQVSQGHVTSVDEVAEKLSYDLFYIKHVSPWLDLVVCLRTITTVLRGFGAK